jgi:hypothetical protein
MRAQVAGNCSYASLNAMMRYLVLRKCGDLNEEIWSETAKKASGAACAPDFYCRMKSMDLVTEHVKASGGNPNPDEIRFLERILEANVYYFSKYAERRCSANAGNKRAEIRSKFAACRETIYGAKIRCSIAAGNDLPIREERLQNSPEIAGALPMLSAKVATGSAQAT